MTELRNTWALREVYFDEHGNPSMHREPVSMTSNERERELDRSPVDASWEAGDAFMEGIYAAEAHHGITAQAKKETP